MINQYTNTLVSESVIKNITLLNKLGLLEPVMELIEKLNLNNDDLDILADLISRNIKNV